MTRILHSRTFKLYGVLLGLTVVPSLGSAQGVLIDGGAGVVFPVGDFSRWASMGASASVTLGYAWSREAAIEVEVRHEFTGGKSVGDPAQGAPPPVIDHLMVAVERSGPVMSLSGLRWRVRAGAGGARLDFGSFTAMTGPDQGRTIEVSGVHPAVQAGGGFRYELADYLALTADGSINRILADRDEISRLEFLGPGVEAPQSFWTVPLRLGIRVEW